MAAPRMGGRGRSLLVIRPTRLDRRAVSDRHAPGFRGRAHPGCAGADDRSKVMVLFAELWQNPGGIVAWVVVGLVAGWLAGVVMKGGGYGFIGDIIVGLVGALVGGF